MSWRRIGTILPRISAILDGARPLLVNPSGEPPVRAGICHRVHQPYQWRSCPTFLVSNLNRSWLSSHKLVALPRSRSRRRRRSAGDTPACPRYPSVPPYRSSRYSRTACMFLGSRPLRTSQGLSGEAGKSEGQRWRRFQTWPRYAGLPASWWTRYAGLPASWWTRYAVPLV